MSQRDSEQKSVFSVWPRCDRAASGRLFVLSCVVFNPGSGTAPFVQQCVFVSPAGNFSISALVYMKELKNNAFVGDTARWCADTAMSARFASAGASTSLGRQRFRFRSPWFW